RGPGLRRRTGRPVRDWWVLVLVRTSYSRGLNWFMVTPGQFVLTWMVGMARSRLVQQDVAADGGGADHDVVLAVLRGAGALEPGVGGAGDGVDVGPDRRPRGDADLDVA